MNKEAVFPECTGAAGTAAPWRTSRSDTETSAGETGGTRAPSSAPSW